MKTFNTEGPMDCREHYCLPPLERIDLKAVLRLIDAKKYFLLHAPRQTGKTTCLLALLDFTDRDDSFSGESSARFPEGGAGPACRRFS
uniref:AAA-ATPase-like domain-containing protein n=1 Tax=Desulfatirhabdium butyrativorans TaxID=340467 RepID=A0A7C4VZX5_9BACT